MTIALKMGENNINISSIIKLVMADFTKDEGDGKYVVGYLANNGFNF